MLVAVLATSAAPKVAFAFASEAAWLHPAILLVAALQAAWLCWVSLGVKLLPRDERPVAWRRRDAVRMAVAASLAGATVLSALLALRHALPADLAVAFCVAAGFAACAGAFALGRLVVIVHDWRQRRARRARRAGKAGSLPAAVDVGGQS